MIHRPLPRRKTIAGIRFILDEFGTYIPENLDPPRKIVLRKPSDCLPLLLSIRRSKQEVFMVITVDGANQAIRALEITKGLVNQSQVHPRETFFPAILDHAVSIILAHNHPSGNLTPSPEDLSTTRRMAEAGKTMGIKVQDHLIVTEDGYLSIRERFPDYLLPGF